MEQVTTILDVHNLLKRFGILVYTGDRLGDLELMAEELQELFDLGLIERQTPIYRGVHLGVVAASFSIVVALGNWAAAIPWVGVLTVSLIAMAAVLVCNALSVGPPGAYMFVLACAAGIGVAAEHLASWHIGLLVAAGGAFAWLVHMSGALLNFRGPEKSAVGAAAEGVAQYLDAIGSPDEESTRRKAAAALHQSWNVLVTFQSGDPRPNSTLQQLRVNNHELHILFAQAMTAAAERQPLPAACRAAGPSTRLSRWPPGDLRRDDRR